MNNRANNVTTADSNDFEPSTIGWKFVNSMRSHSYTISTAIPEKIDNSDDALATIISVFLESNGTEKNKFDTIVIADNGHGMDEETLRGSFKFGFDRANRNSKQHGKFGMGGTTSSLSLARKKLVISKHSSGMYAREYDLDEVQKNDSWGTMSVDITPDIIELFNKYVDSKSPTGTVIILSDLDRVRNNSISYWKSSLFFNLGVSYSEKIDLGLIQINVNNEPVKSRDPLLWDHPDIIQLHDADLGTTGMRLKVVSIENLDKKEAKLGNLKRSLLNFSGLYVFRGGRLIEGPIHKSDRWVHLPARTMNKRDYRAAIYYDANNDNEMQTAFNKMSTDPLESIDNTVGTIINPIVNQLANNRDKKQKVPEEKKEQLLKKSQSVLNNVVDTFSKDLEKGIYDTYLDEENVTRIDVKKHSRTKRSSNRMKIQIVDMSNMGPPSVLENLLDDPDYGYALKINSSNPFIVKYYNKGSEETRETVETFLASMSLARMASNSPDDCWDEFDEKFFKFLKGHSRMRS